MRALITGGSGVIGAGAIPALLNRGHQIRLLTRGADRAAAEWPDEVESFPGDVTRPDDLDGAAEGCDAVIHISGIVTEAPPDVTFDSVNVGGTANLIAEAVRAGTPRFIYLSSLGADTGSSGYHASKLEAEGLVAEYPGPWIILRPGNVYGPGDEVISMLLRMHRTLPALPVIGFGDHEFQPIFYADLGEAIAEAVDRDDLTGIFELAGDEVTTPAAILGAFSELTGRNPVSIPVPEAAAGLAARVAAAAGVPFPLDESKFLMLIERNVIEDPERNALTRVFGVEPTPLAEGLAFLADAQPEQEPTEGVGSLERKWFWADIADSGLSAAELMAVVRERCTEFMSVEFDAEPGAPQEIAEGVSLTAALPLRGNIQVRVEEVTPRRFTFATLRGNPLAGVVRFEAEDVAAGVVRFTITVMARAATMVDWVAMKTVGRLMQDDNWRTVVSRVVEASGGVSTGVESDREMCDEETAAGIEREITGLIARRKRQENPA
jgi:uncharacterized protein YbjT (DUF2867 family)